MRVALSSCFILVNEMSEPFPEDEPKADLLAAANLATELGESLRQQSAVAEFSRVALAAPSIAELLDEAARHAADGLGAPLSKVLEYLPAEDVLLVRAGVGWRDGVVGAAKLGTDTASPAGYALKTGRPVLSNHLAVEARFRTPALIAEHGVRRAINVVVRGEGEPFGVLEADSRDPGEFSEHDIAFLQSMANTLGLAIDRERERAACEVLLVEKEMLVQEAHHRVKNSLQLVQAVLSLQARAETAPSARRRLEETAQRVRTIAAVHERLYRAADEAVAGSTVVPGMVAVRPYLEALVADLCTMLGAEARQRSVTLSADEAAWPVADVPPLGLVLTELVTNAFKHGQGRVTVEFRHLSAGSGSATLTVADEGPGPPQGFDPLASSGLGMRLVVRLLRARNGRLAVEDDGDGAYFIAIFGPGGETTGRSRRP